MAGYIQFVLIKLAYLLLPLLGWYVAARHWKSVGAWTLVAWVSVRSIVVLCLLEFTALDSFDLHGWYLHAGWIVSGMGVPGRDFLTPYSPGFEYLNALAVWLWNSEYSIAILFALFECLGVVLLKRPLSILFGDEIAVKSLIMFESSTIVLESSIATQDETILLFGVSLVLWAHVSCWHWLKKFFACVVTLISTKILAPFYFACLCLTDRWKGVFAIGASIVVVFLLEYVVGADPQNIHFGRELGVDVVGDEILTGLEVESSSIWWYLPIKTRGVMNGIVLISFALTILIYFKALVNGSRNSRLAAAISCISVLGLCFQFFYPSFYRCYLIPLLPFVFTTVLLGRRRQGVSIVCVIAWGVLSAGILPGTPRWDNYRWVTFLMFAISHWLLVYVLLRNSRTFLTTPLQGLLCGLNFLRGKCDA